MFASRAQAAASVLAGDVLLLPERRRAEKPGQLVADDVELELVKAPPFVSRGGIKLSNALDSLGLSVAGRRALDVGASTGGLHRLPARRPATAHVVALDVAYGELDWRLRSDPRVTVIERCNARSLRCELLPYAPDLIVDRRLVHLGGQGAAGRAGLRGGSVRLPGADQAAVRGRAARQVGKGGVVRDAAAAAPRAGRRGLGGARARGLRARLCQLRAARSEGQPRDVRVAGRGGRGEVDLERAALEVEP